LPIKLTLYLSNAIVCMHPSILLIHVLLTSLTSLYSTWILLGIILKSALVACLYEEPNQRVSKEVIPHLWIFDHDC
jgi:hypothetical protein